jgi:hypothetical protein
MIMLGGQGSGLSGEPMPAAAIMQQLIDELARASP